MESASRRKQDPHKDSPSQPQRWPPVTSASLPCRYTPHAVVHRHTLAAHHCRVDTNRTQSSTGTPWRPITAVSIHTARSRPPAHPGGPSLPCRYKPHAVVHRHTLAAHHCRVDTHRTQSSTGTPWRPITAVSIHTARSRPPAHPGGPSLPDGAAAVTALLRALCNSWGTTKHGVTATTSSTKLHPLRSHFELYIIIVTAIERSSLQFYRINTTKTCSL